MKYALTIFSLAFKLEVRKLKASASSIVRNIDIPVQEPLITEKTPFSVTFQQTLSSRSETPGRISPRRIKKKRGKRRFTGRAPMPQGVSDRRIAKQRQKTWSVVSEANVSSLGGQLRVTLASEMQNGKARTTLGFGPCQSKAHLEIHSTRMLTTKP